VPCPNRCTLHLGQYQTEKQINGQAKLASVCRANMYPEVRVDTVREFGGRWLVV
jgi:hypothetical protein